LFRKREGTPYEKVYKDLKTSKQIYSRLIHQRIPFYAGYNERAMFRSGFDTSTTTGKLDLFKFWTNVGTIHEGTHGYLHSFNTVTFGGKYLTTKDVFAHNNEQAKQELRDLKNLVKDTDEN